ncbi:hypothetical protein CCO03_09860 [Comamonas serinivorans]|uniref:LysR substrate-binding domain-containing protein n=1 Tax=Comamonas serinivorans TaxID=1082851 RepID=A0A1Y0EMQ0_9BURK|nr:hypothetical protein CCO03_09860 [Comamonas serinivorans]
MVRVPLTQEVPLVIVGSPDYLAQCAPPRTAVNLLRHRCIQTHLPSGAPSSWPLRVKGRSVEMDVPGPLVCDAPLLMREAARSGTGLAQLARWYVADDIARGTPADRAGQLCAATAGAQPDYAGHRHVPAALRALVALAHELREQATSWHPDSCMVLYPQPWPLHAVRKPLGQNAAPLNNRAVISTRPSEGCTP